MGLGEGEVTLVLRRDSHDGPGPIAHEHVVGYVDGHGLVVERVQAVAAREGAALVERALRRLALDVGLLLGSDAKFGDLVPVGFGHEFCH